MAAEQSQFSKVPKKILVFICEKLVDNEFPIGNPYYDDFNNAFNILENVSKYLNITATQDDVEFFSKLLEINNDLIADLFANNREQMKNKELIQKLVIPEAKSYILHYDTKGTCSFTEFLSQEFDCYDEEWVRDSAETQRTDGNWDVWGSPERHPTEYDNYEYDDFDYGDVIPVDDIKLKRESIFNKLVVENTSEIVNSLDRKTLLELRRIIDSKLRLL